MSNSKENRFSKYTYNVEVSYSTLKNITQVSFHVLHVTSTYTKKLCVAFAHFYQIYPKLNNYIKQPKEIYICSTHTNIISPIY